MAAFEARIAPAFAHQHRLPRRRRTRPAGSPRILPSMSVDESARLYRRPGPRTGLPRPGVQPETGGCHVTPRLGRRPPRRAQGAPRAGRRGGRRRNPGPVPQGRGLRGRGPRIRRRTRAVGVPPARVGGQHRHLARPRADHHPGVKPRP
ncbi:hypothetical protein ACRAWF_23050 [Streptomyces sp. L7]